MNHLYRSLWNDVTRTFVAVAEVASGRGKRSSGSRTAGTGDTAVAPARTLLRPMALEPRLMFDAAAVATVVEAVHADTPMAAESDHAAALAEAAQHLVQVQMAPPAVAADRHEVVFIDTSIANWQTLRDGVATGVDVVLLDAQQDGLAQMAQWAATHSGYDAIHVLSHGFEGGIFLGGRRVDATALEASAAQLSTIGGSLTAQGDILLYGCNVALGAGQAFAERLAALTGADVAASNDATGAAGKGGDWMLEASVGSVEAASLSTLDGYDGLLVAGSVLASGSTSDVTKGLNVNVGLEKLSNGNTAVAYLSQIAGDYLDIYTSLFDGVLQVLDGNNSVIKTINLRSDFALPNDQYVVDASVESLANGGFVVAWSQQDLDFNSTGVRYAIYDNAGNLQSNGTLATTGRGPSVAAQANGDFAIAYQLNNAKQQVAVAVFDYGGSGFSFTPLTQTLVGDSTTAVAGSDADTNRLYFTFAPPVLTALSDGNYVFTANTYDWVSSTYTPLGVFAFKLDAAGALANFASGKSWQRVDWDSSQSAPASVQSFSGGYAVIAHKVVSSVATWQVTVYNNDGTLRTTTQQTAQVYNNGNFGPKSYYAVDIATIDMAMHDQLAYSVNNGKALSATMYDNGTDLVFVFPESSGGLKTATISKTTGQLVGSVTSSGITVPAGGMLFNPRFIADGGGYDITYSVVYDKDAGDGATAGYAIGDIYQIGLDVTSSNAAPIATTTGGTTAFTEGNNVASTPVVVDSGLTLSDADNTTFASGTVTISGGFQNGQDTLAFTNNPATMGNITGSYAAGTGVLSLTSAGATATVAQWQAALRSVTYGNSSDTPNTANRTISFVVNDGTSSSSAATKTVSVTAVNDTPVATTSGGTTAFTEGNNVASTPVAVDSGLTLSDTDSAQLSTAEVSISGGFQAGQDVLAFINTNTTVFGNIVASYAPGTGVLTLTSAGATATVAQWQAALRSVTYSNSSDTPNTANRTVSFAVNDGSTTSNAATKTVSVTATNDAPVITASGGATATSDGSPIAVDAGIALSDADSSTLASATVSIGAGFQSGEDVLAFTNDDPVSFGNITGSYTAGTGVLTLSSAGTTATVAQWQAALAAVTYASTAGTPTPGTRTVSFVVNDGTADSTAGVKTVSLQSAPVLANLNGDSVAWAGVGASVALDVGGNAGATDAELDALNSGNGNWQGATLTVQRAGTAVGADQFGFNAAGAAFTVTGTTSGNLQSGGQTFATYSLSGGVLSISFTSTGTTATRALVDNVLQRITYRNDTPAGDATVRLVLADGAGATAAADVTVTSDFIYVTNTTDTAIIDASNGVSLSEAVAIAAADTTGSQTLVLSSAFNGATISLAGALALNESLTLNADAATSLTISAGATITLGSGTTLSFTNTSGSVTVAAALAGSGTLDKSGAGTLVLSNTGNRAGMSGNIAVNGGKLSIAEVDHLSSGAVRLDGGTLQDTGTVAHTLSNLMLIGSGGATFAKSGSGALTLSGTLNGSGAITTTTGAEINHTGNGTLTLDGAGITTASSSKLTLSSDVVLGSGGATFAAAADIVLRGAVSGSGDYVKSGNGLLSLYGANTHSGTQTINAGQLVLNASSSLGTGQIRLGGSTSLRFVDVGTVSVANDIVLTGNATILCADGSTSIVTLAGTRSESGGARNLSLRSGTGTDSRLIVTGAASYTGTTNVGQKVTINDGSNLGSGTVSLGVGATLQIDGSNATVSQAISLSGDSAISVTDSATLSGALSGIYVLTKTGTGSLALTGTNTHTGRFTVAAGTVALSGGSSLSNTNYVTVDAGATLVLNADETVGGLAGAGSVSLGANTLTTAANTSTTFSGAIGGTGGLTKQGTGTLTLSGANTYTGSTTLSAGTLALAGGAAIADTSAVVMSAGTTLTLSASEAVGSLTGAGSVSLGSHTLTAGGNGASGTFAGVISGTGGLTKTGSGTLALTGNNTYTGATTVSAGTLDANRAGGAIADASAVTVAAGATLRVMQDETVAAIAGAGTVSLNSGYLLLAGGASTTFSGQLSGAGALYHDGGGTLTLSGSNSGSHSGDIFVRFGSTLSVAGDDNLGSGTVTLNGGTLTLTAAGTIDNALDLAGSGGTVVADAAATLSGAITGSSGTLTKAGLAALTLSGTSSYTGSTTVQAGRLQVTGALDGTADVSVASGATLAGTGSIGTAASNGLVMVQSGGILAPGLGANSTGTLTLKNGLTLQSGAQLVAEVRGSSAGSGYDQVAVQGSVNLNSGTLTVDLGSYTPGAGEAWRIIDNDGSDAFLNTFNGIAEGGQISAGRTLLVSYVGGTGNDLVLTVQNTAPTVANALTAQTAAENSAFGFTVPANTFADADTGDTLTYAATLTSGAPLPSWLSFNAATRSFSGTPGTSDIGTISVRVTATDGSNASASSDFTLTVDNTNDAPTVANPLAAQSASQGSAFGFTVPASTFADVDAGDTLSYTAKLASGATLPSWLSFDAATRTFSGTPANGDVGVISVRVTATDGSGASASSSFTLTVANTNDAPSSSAIDAQSAAEGSAFGFTLPAGTFTDVDAGDTLTYTATLADGSALPAWLRFDAATRSFSGTPRNGDAGSITVKVTASDTSNASASSSFTLTVADANDAPTVANALVPQSASEGSAFGFTVPADTFIDVDAGDSLTYTATLANGDALPAWLSFNAATRAFSGTPANGDVGAISVRVTATDRSGASAASDFTLTVANVNDAPTSTPISAQTATEDSAFNFTLPAGTFTDVDAGDTLTYTATLANGAALPAWLRFDAATRTFSGTPANGDVGAISVRVTATDRSGANAASDFTLTVANTNDAPTVTSAIAAQAATEDSAFGFTVPTNTFTDVDAGDSLTYTATLANGAALPAWLSFDAATRTFSGTPANGDVGAISVRLTATDRSGASAASSFTLTVANTNDAPTVTSAITAQGATAQDAFSFTVPANTFADVDAGDTLRYTATLANGAALPAWLSFNAATRTFSGTPSNGDAGAISVRVTATDGSNASASASFTLTVEAVPEPPVPTSPAAPVITVTPAPAVTVPPPVSEPAPVGLGFLSTNASGANLSSQPLGMDLSILLPRETSTVTLAPSRGDTTEQTAPLRVLPDLGDFSARVGTELRVQLPDNFIVQGGDEGNVTIQARLADGRPLPAWLTFDPKTKTLTGRPPAGMNRTLTVEIIVRDSQGQRATSQLDIQVQATPRQGASLDVPADARPGLSEQLRSARLQQRGTLAERLAGLPRTERGGAPQRG